MNGKRKSIKNKKPIILSYEDLEEDLHKTSSVCKSVIIIKDDKVQIDDTECITCNICIPDENNVIKNELF